MIEVGKAMVDTVEHISESVETYKEIKAEDVTVEEANNFWDNEFENLESRDETITMDTAEFDETEADLEKTLNEYFDDLKSNSECPETIPDRPFESSDLEKISPEENAKMREEFVDKKAELKKEWEEMNGRSWPKYEQDVYSANGKLIRKAGSDYDAHHIQPLGMGGKNEASNLTPLSAEVHYDKQGVHAPDSPYSKLDDMLGDME